MDRWIDNDFHREKGRGTVGKQEKGREEKTGPGFIYEYPLRYIRLKMTNIG